RLGFANPGGARGRSCSSRTDKPGGSDLPIRAGRGVSHAPAGLTNPAARICQSEPGEGVRNSIPD
ncbi:hypothetical protein QUF72_22920, partial [Desulfobacterales bacterium HSG2]|nr:hypothetical protein [Desulfobacterales bacterium HSG2]